VTDEALELSLVAERRSAGVPARGPVAFVVPRFGAGVVGGAESVCAEAAAGLAGRGWEIEVLTTCAVDHYTWANDLPAGVSRAGGVTVRRWEAVHAPSPVGLRAQQRIDCGQVPDYDSQISWLSSRFQVPGLFQHLLHHGVRYQAVVFAPYLFWTSTVCLPLVAERAVSMPCLHDEVYAHLDVVRPVLSDPAAVWFLSGPEHQLAHRLGPVAPRHAEVGAGVSVPAGYDPQAFRRRHRLGRPFVLYAGRRERDKGWPWLVETFGEALERSGADFDLVTVGVGQPDVPVHLAGRVLDLGWLPDHELPDAFAAAAAYVQPSRMESFSRTVMESWLAGTPVLAWDRSPVVVWHCQRSGGGRTFSDAADLAMCLKWLETSPGEAAHMAVHGREYVLRQYTWPAVLDRMEATLTELPSPPGGSLTAGSLPDAPRAVGGGRVMVVGSYPPSPLPGATVTLQQVREALSRGDEVVVVSPRRSAGHYTCRVAGWKAAARIEELRAQTGARRLVMCVEAGLPFPAGSARLPSSMLERWNRAVARRLAATFPGFSEVTVVSATGVAVPAGCWAILAAAADRVVIVPGPAGALPPAPVSVFGPPEVLASQLPRKAVGRVARAVLGPYAPPVRRRLAAGVRRLRTAVGRSPTASS
jgi:glycosyltransferase involved in cell wall biosynthesis